MELLRYGHMLFCVAKYSHLSFTFEYLEWFRDISILERETDEDLEIKGNIIINHLNMLPFY